MDSDNKEGHRKKSKLPIFFIGLVVGFLAILFAIIFLMIYSHFTNLKRAQENDRKKYESALQKCGKKPYMFIYKNDPIEGVGLGGVYYEPTHPNYEKARRNTPGEGVGLFSLDYNIKYECDSFGVNQTDIKRGE